MTGNRASSRYNLISSFAPVCLLFGCAANDEGPQLQEHAFSDEYLYDGVRFYAGPWYAPGADFAYQYSDGVIILSEAVDGEYVLSGFEVTDCPGLPAAYEQLIASIAESVDAATGRKSIPEPEIIVMDGPTYVLQFSGGPASTDITLEGGGNAELKVPWVSAAKSLGQIAFECADKQSSNAQPVGDACDLEPGSDEMATLKANVRNHLRGELGESYTYYDTEDSVLDAIVSRENSCGILIFPAGDADDGKTLLHGEGVVLFDRRTLLPTEVQFYSW